jgi:hypothetical protein
MMFIGVLPPKMREAGFHIKKSFYGMLASIPRPNYSAAQNSLPVKPARLKLKGADVFRIIRNCSAKTG